MKSIIKAPEGSILVGLAEASAVYVIYQSSLPSHADIQSAPAHDATIESSRKKAAWKSAAVLGFVFLLSHDLNSFLIGGLALAGVDIMSKHSNGVNPATNHLSLSPGSAITQPLDAAQTHPMPDYGYQPEMSY
jgi:hypothetical protein